MNKIKNFFLIFIITIFCVQIAYAKNSYFDEGEKLFKEKKFSQSKYNFEKDIVFNPKNEKSYLYLAKIFKFQKKQSLEEQNLKTVILLDPKNEEALYLLTLLKLNKSDYEGSQKLIGIFKKVCVKICDKQTELNKKFENLEPK
tara:strand:- start:62 stop:490 length:429 start_codon:yes stop_codon:yes gene_type:complete